MTARTAADHYAEAEQLLAEYERVNQRTELTIDPLGQHLMTDLLLKAQVHATLAGIAPTDPEPEPEPEPEPPATPAFPAWGADPTGQAGR